MISQKTQGQIFHKRKAVPTPDSVKHKLRSTQGALPKVNVDAQKALDTAGSAFKIKIVVSIPKNTQSTTTCSSDV